MTKIKQTEEGSSESLTQTIYANQCFLADRDFLTGLFSKYPP